MVDQKIRNSPSPWKRCSVLELSITVQREELQHSKDVKKWKKHKRLIVSQRMKMRRLMIAFLCLKSRYMNRFKGENDSRIRHAIPNDGWVNSVLRQFLTNGLPRAWGRSDSEWTGNPRNRSLSHPWLRGSQRPDGKTQSTFPLLILASIMNHFTHSWRSKDMEEEIIDQILQFQHCHWEFWGQLYTDKKSHSCPEEL